MNNIILIPYRNREEHLDYFIKNSVPLLKKHLDNLKVIVVEQVNDKLFNRGMLLNIGFDIYKDTDSNFIIHDVDINPMEECIEKFYTQPVNNNIISIYSDSRTLGGIIKFKKNEFIKMNGFPNNFWGWGVEDRVLQNRAIFNNIEIIRNIRFENEEKHNYLKIFNNIDDRVKSDDFGAKTNFEYHYFDNISVSDKHNIIYSNGLNTLNYKIYQTEKINENVEIIKVFF